MRARIRMMLDKIGDSGRRGQHGVERATGYPLFHSLAGPQLCSGHDAILQI
jgi:hypothetical protein